MLVRIQWKGNKHLCSVAGNINWCTMEDRKEVMQLKKKKNYCVTQQLHLWIFVQRKQKTLISIDACTLMFTTVPFTAAKAGTINRWRDIKDCSPPYTKWNIFQPKKKEILPFAIAWKDLKGITQSEISQREKNKYHTISLIGGIKKQKWTNKTLISWIWI